jgi:hypothetical protein
MPYSLYFLRVRFSQKWMSGVVFWGIQPCTPVRINYHFREIFSIFPHNIKENKWTWNRKQIILRAWKLKRNFRKVSWLSTDYTELYPGIYCLTLSKTGKNFNAHSHDTTLHNTKYTLRTYQINQQSQLNVLTYILHTYVYTRTNTRSLHACIHSTHAYIFMSVHTSTYIHIYTYIAARCLASFASECHWFTVLNAILS